MSDGSSDVCSSDLRLLQARPMLLDVAELARTQPFAKRFGTVADMTGTHEKIGEMRSRRCVAAVAEFLLKRPRAFQRTRHPLRFEALADQFGAEIGRAHV